MLISLAYNLPTCFLNHFLIKELWLLLSTMPSWHVSVMLNTCASGVLICCVVSVSILGDIPPNHGDLFSFILLILLATTSGVTTYCPNLSPSDPLNFVSGTGIELVSSRVNTELKCIFNSPAIKIPVFLYFRHCPPVVQPYLEHSAYFLHTHRH